MRILVISPHRDDAAFSLSISIIRWLAASHSVTLLNCYTRSLYAPFSDSEDTHPNDRLSYVSAIRRREDEFFLRQVPGAKLANLTMFDLNLKDAPLRLRCSSDVVCDLEVDGADPSIEKIRRSLTRSADAGQIDALVLPLALGHHVDHRTARDAALPFSTAYPCAFYEDLPYATRAGVQADLANFRDDATTRLHEPLYPVVCHAPQGPEMKGRLALGYASQIDRSTADLITSFSSRYDGGERLWVNAAWLSLAETSGLSAPQLEPQPLPA